MGTLDMVESTDGKTEGLWDTDLTLPPPNAGLALLPAANLLCDLAKFPAPLWPHCDAGPD